MHICKHFIEEIISYTKHLCMVLRCSIQYLVCCVTLPPMKTALKFLDMVLYIHWVFFSNRCRCYLALMVYNLLAILVQNLSSPVLDILDIIDMNTALLRGCLLSKLLAVCIQVIAFFVKFTFFARSSSALAVVGFIHVSSGFFQL